MLTETQIRVILSTLWDLEKQISDEREAVFDLEDIDTQVLRFGYNALKELPQEKRVTMLTELIEVSKNLYYPLHLVAVIQQDYEKETARAGDSFVSKSELKQLQVLLVKKIKLMVEDGTIISEKNLPAILYRWSDWESKTVVEEFIRTLVSTRQGFLTFLKSFVGKTLSTSGNYNDLNKKSIEGLYPLTEVETLVNAITDEELLETNPQEREAVNLFRNPPKEW